MLLVVVEVVLGRVGQIGQGRMGMGRRMVGSDGHSWFFLLCSSSVCKMTTQIGLSGTKERTDEDKSKLWEKDKNSRYPAYFLNRVWICGSTAAIFLATTIKKEP